MHTKFLPVDSQDLFVNPLKSHLMLEGSFFIAELDVKIMIPSFASVYIIVEAASGLDKSMFTFNAGSFGDESPAYEVVR